MTIISSDYAPKQTPTGSVRIHNNPQDRNSIRSDAPHILVVDDEPEVANVLVRVLELHGYKTTAAFDGDEALNLVTSGNFELVVTDLQMPRLRGDELQRSIHVTHPDMAVMLITAAHDTDIAVECLKQGAYDYVLKPFDIQDVVVRVEKALQRRSISLQLKDYQSNLQQKVDVQATRIRSLLLQSMESLTQALEAKDENTRNHSQRVAELVCRLGNELYPHDDEMIAKWRIAGMLHDIGKIGCPEEILRKPGNLTKEEYEEVKKHPALGEAILRPIFEGDDIMLAMVRHHHERWDGSGYPDSLVGEESPLCARALAIADAYDAMTSSRPYRAGMSSDAALQVLKSDGGKQWDPTLVSAFVNVIESRLPE